MHLATLINYALFSLLIVHAQESYEGSLRNLMDELEIVMKRDPLLSSYDLVITQNMFTSDDRSGVHDDDIINK